MISIRASGSRRAGPRSPERSGRIELVERLGVVGDPGLADRVICRHFAIPDEHDPECEREAEQLVRESSGTVPPSSRQLASLAEQRRDLRGLYTVTIDGADARDFDDAISVESLGDGHRLWVHIADVAHWVRPGTHVDEEARRRGTSVYLPDRAIHMLPAGLAENLCSLRPGVERFCFSVALDFDKHGRRTGEWIGPTLIVSDSRLIYEQAEAMLVRGGASPAAQPSESLSSLAEQPEVLAKTRGLLLEAAVLEQRIHRHRRAQGRLEIETAWPALLVDSRGRPASSQDMALRSRRLIETFMIEANIAVAEWLARRLGAAAAGADSVAHTVGNQPEGAATSRAPDAPRAPFRWHPAPGNEGIETLMAACRALGLDLGPDDPTALAGAASNARRALQAALRAAAGTPVSAIVGQLSVRAFARAVYCAEPKGHFALAADFYCHFTSPIRRYPDLVVHRVLRVLLAGEAAAPGAPLPSTRHAGARVSAGSHLEFTSMDAEDLSFLERRAESAEREIARWRGVEKLAELQGESLSGIVSGVETFGLFVTIPELGADGLVYIESLGEPSFLADDARTTLSRGAIGYRLGDRVSVRVAETRIEERRARFELLTPARPLLPRSAGPDSNERRGEKSGRRR